MWLYRSYIRRFFLIVKVEENSMLLKIKEAFYKMKNMKVLFQLKKKLFIILKTTLYLITFVFSYSRNHKYVLVNKKF